MEDLYIWAILIPIIVVFILIIFVAIKIAITQKRRTNLAKESYQTEVDEELQMKFLDSLGGKENIENVSHEMSRITFRVNDLNKVDLEQLKALGATGILVMGNDIKCAFGERAEEIYQLIK